MNRKRVLLVDDDPWVRTVVEMTLGEDYETLNADDGYAGVEMARSYHPDLVLMDISMPGLSGLDACAMLKADPTTRSMVVIMLTGTKGEAELHRAQELGADGFFAKPFSPLALRAAVERYLQLIA